jgi:hypothetical protein
MGSKSVYLRALSQTSSRGHLGFSSKGAARFTPTLRFGCTSADRSVGWRRIDYCAARQAEAALKVSDAVCDCTRFGIPVACYLAIKILVEAGAVEHATIQYRRPYVANGVRVFGGARDGIGGKRCDREQ